MIYRLILGCLFSLCSFFNSAFAKNIEHKELNFGLKSLSSQDIHYSFKLINKSDNSINPSFKPLETYGMKGVKGRNLVMVKSVFIVNKPFHFFHRNILFNINYNKAVIGANRVYKKSETTLRFENSGAMAYSYDMTMYLDSFDAHSINEDSSRIFDNFKFMDDSLGPVETMVLRYGRNFSSKGNGSVTLTNHIAIANKTIFITYSIVSLKPIYAWGSIVKNNILREIMSLQQRINQY